MKAPPLLTALSVLCPALALGATTHWIVSTECSGVAEPGFYSPVSSSNVLISWTEGASATFDGQATATTGAQYSFQLVSVTSAPTAYEIWGNWNITKNGAPLCTNCLGHAYGLTGSYFKVYIQGENYFLGCKVSSRSDY